MIPLLGKSTITRLRYGPPSTVDFQPVRPAPASSSIRATVAPASRSTIKRAAENGHEVDHLVDVFSYDELSAGEEGGAYPDRLVLSDGTYELMWARRQPPYLGQPEHWEAAAERVQPITFDEPEQA